MRRNAFSLTALVVSCVLFGWGTTSAEDDYFRDHVAGILQQRCLSCHNNRDQKGDFSLQTASSTLESGYLEPGDSAASDLIDMITPQGGKSGMPKGSDPLPAEQIAAIRKWIDDGAKWPKDFELTPPKVADLQWWSLQPLKRPEVPARWNSRSKPPTQNATKDQPRQLKLRSPIDAFIQESLAKKGLSASTEADRRTILRRLYYDLIGLPPTPEEMTEFLRDDSRDAYEKQVDRLLASPRYGERWARHWLDVVHYADTHGYDKDKPRPNAWPYRDYVIRSLNADKPYRRFVMEQIAGDALWPDTTDGVTATGFIAAGPWDFIGHAEVPETKIDGRIARHLDRDDMVTSTMNTFCSVTIQCARCHNHKFDPVTQEHYYSLQSVFAALDRADRPFDQDPETSRRRVELKQRQAELAAEKVALESVIQGGDAKQLASIEAELAKLNKQQGSGAKPEFGYHSRIAKTSGVVKWVQVDLGKPTLIETIVYVGCHDDFNGIGSGFGFPPRYKIEVSDDEKFQSGVTVVVDHSQADVANPGVKPQRAKAGLGLKARFARMTAVKLAPRHNDFIFALAEMIILTPDGRNAARGKRVTSLDSIQAPVRWQRRNLVDGYYVGVGGGAAKSPERIAELTKQRTTLLDRALTDELKAQIKASQAAILKTTNELKALPASGKVYAGTVHRGKGNFIGTGAKGGRPRPIHLLHRGNILSPREEMTPGTVPIIAGADWKFSLPEKHDESDRRAALARWLTRDDNPLTWRSIVNRVWQHHFGRGLVDSPNDFGRMGKTPSHPELLDWLAVEFRDGGQSLKKLHKLIVTSSAYRQSSAYHKANHQVDADNVYLWRMNRRRLAAEEVRDAVLAVSGQLNPEMGGPGFRLFVIERPQHSPHYEYHKHNPEDPKSHRRSIYRFIVRSQPDPFMTSLDCADSSQSVPKRDETVTALQALSLLNNQFMLLMAERFAERVQKESDDPARQAGRAFELATNRRPTEEELAALVESAERLGMDNVCRVLLNLNEFVFVD